MKTIQNLVDQGIDKSNIEDAINGFKTKSDVPLSPEQITERLSLLADLSKEYPDIPQELIFGLAQNGNINAQIIMDKVGYNGYKEILDIAKNYPQHQKQLLTLLQNDQYYCRKLSDYDIECGVKYESNNIYQYLKNLENPRFKDIADLTCFLDALTGLKDWYPNLHGIEKYNQLNTLIHGAEPKEFKQIKDDFKAQTGANLHLDNNIPPDKAKIYMEKAIEDYNTIKAAGKNPPKDLFLTEWVTEGAGGIFARTNEVNSYNISVRPTDKIGDFNHAIIHESIHMLDRNTLRKEIDGGFRFAKVGTDFVVKDGVYYKVIDNQKIERMSGYARRYISNYAGDPQVGSIHELCAELGSMLLEKKIIVKNIYENDGLITDFDVKIKEPYTNIDGVRIDFTDEMRAELKELIEYYFSVGGQNFSEPLS